ncbi:pyridoxamine 5'-phosphate oxidase family protein [Rugosimonospora africana]|uniref:Pyridoxamine 5'-phosphate oxidase N-terminal domain-containing protein n=1 Tax=Rugosimonospora africana TaxID=556532 RepID=A0A8J3QRP2_9ACTN|nr:pyridoxamine 5'-phosphate oxidase family protein [Rugosimonospora africana]GIH14420.1 hypothetical protein Raf01_25920 [Rugosimonospora africana]
MDQQRQPGAAGVPFDVGSFLAEERRLAQVASVAPSGIPLLGSLWFRYERGRFWFSSLAGSPLPTAASRGRRVAVIVDDFNPPASIRQVRIRGRGRIEAHDAETVRRIYRRYLGPEQESWPEFFRLRAEDSERWLLWSVRPDSGLVVTSPEYGELERRWTRMSDCPLP